MLGSGDSVDQILQQVEDREFRQMKLQGRARSIEDIMQEACRKRTVSEPVLRKRSRRPLLREARSGIVYRSKEEIGISNAEIDRHLMVTSSINRALAKMDEFIRK